MFFNSKKKIANEIAVAIENSLRPAFILTEYLQDGKFKPPFGFWMDDYIIGFTHQLTALFIKFDFNGDRWPPEKKGEVIIRVFENLCGDDWRQVLNTVRDYAHAENKNQEFIRGTNDAATMYLAVTGRLKPDDPDPILAEAKSLAASMHGTGEALGVESSDSTSLGGAVSMLTINKHIKEKYLEDDEDVAVGAE